MRCVLVTSLCLSSLLAACAPEGPSAYVSNVLILDSDCTVDPDSTEGLASGLYDIAGSTTMRNSACQSSYYMHLVVNSQLKANANTAIGRAEPNVLQINEAEVSLIDIEQQGLIPFDKRSNELPNPFRVKTNITLQPSSGSEATKGAVPVETIPVGYASQLTAYAGKQVMAEIKIFGTTISDIDVDFAPFSFPIRICQGCLTVNCTDFPDLSRADIVGDRCDDNSGADGRLCVIPDPSCTPGE